MAERFNPIHTYSDPGLDKERFLDYELSVRIAPDAFSYCILDGLTGKFLHLESYDLSDPGRKPIIPGEQEEWHIAKLTDLLENTLQGFLGTPARTRILLEWGNVTLVPEALFNEKEISTIYDFNIAGGPIPASDLRHDFLPGMNAYSIYRIPSSVSIFFEHYFPGATIFHHSTALLNGVLQRYINLENEKQLHVNTSRSRMDILSLKGKKLEYFNSFRFNSAEDFMYYLIYVVEKLGMNPETVELLISGEVDKHSALLDLVVKYVRYVQFVKRNEDFRYSFVFDQLPGHYYYNLFNASLCE